jgi:lipid-binding SYLF domain-containing protein
MRSALLLTALLWAGTASAIDWQPDPEVALQVEVADTMRTILEQQPELQRFFDEACGIAVFPRVVRVGLGLGGGRGRGLLLTDDGVLGEVSQSALTLGFQFGGQSFRQLIFFRTCEAMQEFTEDGNLGRWSGRMEFQGRAAVQAGRAGGAADPGFIGDVAIFSLSGRGLMVELAAGGVRYRFTPATDEEQEP